MSETGYKRTKYAKRRKKPKKLINIIFSQKTTIILLLLLQFAFILVTFGSLSGHYTYLRVIFTTMSVVLAILILNTPQNPAYKLAWIIPLMALPAFTTVVYILLNNQPTKRRIKRMYAKKCSETRVLLKTDKALMKRLRQNDPELFKLARYVDGSGGYPAYEARETVYFRSGEEKFPVLAKKLREARTFIFFEYFIVDDGEMWGEIMDILIERAKAGVEIRFLCDGMGSMFTLPARDLKALRAAGVKCHIFNKFVPMISTIQNNRDHRKIVVIDGNTAFSGGINIADEYINRIRRFGYWKDTGIMITGEAVWNFTVMFLQLWEIISGDCADYQRYRPSAEQTGEKKGYVIPFADSPLDNENVGKLVYLHMINSARRYLYITTPYFIPDNEIMTALELASKSGVDVRIIMPGIQDKRYIKYLNESYYRELIEIGVKVYEYEPGFIHAKSFLADGTDAVVGTINLDYRSLYLHFECAAYMHETGCIGAIERDMRDMFRDKCRRIKMEDVQRLSFFSRFASVILRIIAPLL
ncbi:MAG: cardiolipin synthase [Ruminococcus sp.]|nr:cardiolipin synthase [Ruminococcus sp.]